MLSSSHPKIHEPPAIGVSRDTRTGDSTRNCERRGGWSVARRLALAAILTALISALPLVAEASAASAAAGPVFPGMNASESPLVPCRHDVQRELVGGRTGCLPFGVGPLVVHP
jgi:hypothetical protein